ncbi:MAG: 4-hydroxy-3-methylbut-2-enyl diphosphate reductase [Oscillospiraceae bacterium]
MKIEIADSAGFCFGVDRAVNIAYDNLKTDIPTYTYGMLIHNRDVVDDLAVKGIVPIENICDIPQKSNVIIRAHGISKLEYDEILKRGANIIDATCPYVKKIHNIVANEHKKGREIVIVGDKNHPEVKGINGWCENSAIIIKDEDEICKILTKSSDVLISFVAQTTIRKKKFKKVEEISKKHFTNAVFFDTICSATEKRQISAEKLSKEVEVMFVVGGENSSNTRKLFEVCKENCEHTYSIENNKKLNEYIKLLSQFTKIGVTAGASTPNAVIKEVYLTMADTNEMNFAEALEETLKPLKSGEVVKGVVIGITPTEVQVDVDGKYDGVIPFDELTNDSTANINDLVKVGEELDVYVVHVSDRDGIVKLSKKKIDAAKGMEELKTAFENNEILTCRVVELVRGGVVTIAKGVRVFIPASECSERYLADLGVLLNTEQNFRLIKMEEDRRGRQKVVGSIKVVSKEESDKAAAAFWETAEEGKQYKGIIKSLTSFGAFVDIGGVDGLIHISELSPVRISHPSEAVSVGDEIDVFIKELNKETNRISLVKELKEVKAAEFWANAEVGKKYTGVIKSLTSFGAFVDLGGVDGLVHISELSWNRIKHPSEVVKVGDELDVYIKDIDREKGKISLGYKKEEDSPWIKGTKDLNVGDVIKCKIVRILPFGAFAEVAPFVDGLIHISQISNERINKPSDVLSIGDEVEAKIVEMNEDTKQIGLSIKALLPEVEGADDVAPSRSSNNSAPSSASYTEESSFTLGDILDNVDTGDAE